MKKLYLALLTGVLAGCVTTHPLEKGKTSAVTKPANVSEQTVPQKDTPAPVSRQEPKAVAARNFQSPKSSQMAEPTMIKTESPTMTQTSSSPTLVTSAPAAAVSAAKPVVEQKKTPTNIELRGTHPNTIRKTGTPSSSPKRNMWIAVIGSVALAAGGWFFKQRQDKLRNPVDTQKEDEVLAEKAWRNL